MAQLRVIVRGTNTDHVLESPELTPEDGERQLKTVVEMLPTGKVIELPWATFQTNSVIAAQLFP